MVYINENRTRPLAPLAALLCVMAAPAAHPQDVHIDLAKKAGAHSETPLMTVGAGRAEEGLRADWQSQLAQVQRGIGFRYIRFHGLLHDDMGVYRETTDGTPVYDFQYIDALYDFLLSQHIRPFVELSFMPAKLASGSKTVFWWNGNVTPPKDYGRWDELIQALVHHFIARYGLPEVNSWYFEIWNEPDIPSFWSESLEKYLELYRHTANDVYTACPTCRIGGPAAGIDAEGPWLAFVTKNNLPADFMAVHSYAASTGAFDDTGHAKTILNPSPDAIVQRVKRDRSLIAASTKPTMELHVTEWSTSYTPTDPIHDQYIEAPFIVDRLHAVGDQARSMSYWTFTDIFEEQGPPTLPFHGGFGLINLQGILKPAYFAYRFLGQMSGQDLACSRRQCWATANADGSISVLLWDYSPPTLPPGVVDQDFFKPEQPSPALPALNLSLEHLPNRRFQVREYRVGHEENDAYTAYLHMGSPVNLTQEQVTSLKRKATGDPNSERKLLPRHGSLQITLGLHANEVVFLTLQPM